LFEALLSDLTELTNSELDERIRADELERRRLDAEQAALIAVADHRRLYADDDHRSINAYLRATLDCSSSEASRLRSEARTVDRVDGVGEAWLTGRIGRSQVAQFSRLHGNQRVRDELADATPMLLALAEELPYRDFVLCVDRFLALADQDGAHDARDDAVEHRTADVVPVGDIVDVSAHGGDGLVTAELIAIFERFCDAEFRADVETRRTEHGPNADQQPLPRTARQRRFDALVNIFRSAAGAGSVGSPSDPLVNIVIDVATWNRLLADTGLAPDGAAVAVPHLIPHLLDGDVPIHERRCETSTGIQLHPHDVLRAALSGHVRRVVVDSAGVVIDLGRRQRLFTGAARDAAKLLVRHCEHPGCDLPAAWCDVDHRIEWADGGATDQANSGVRCSRHNRSKSTRRWRARRATDGRSYTIRPDGTVILPVGVRPPTFPPDDDDPDEHTPEEIARLVAIARARLRAFAA
jgi:hypothetical protein